MSQINMEEIKAQPQKISGLSYPRANSDLENGQTQIGDMRSAPKDPWNKRFVDSFRQNKGAAVTPGGVIGADGKVFQPEGQHVPELSHSLKTRHLQMIAIGGSIGKCIAQRSFPVKSRIAEVGFQYLNIS